MSISGEVVGIREEKNLIITLFTCETGEMTTTGPGGDKKKKTERGK